MQTHSTNILLCCRLDRNRILCTREFTISFFLYFYGVRRWHRHYRRCRQGSPNVIRWIHRERYARAMRNKQIKFTHTILYGRSIEQFSLWEYYTNKSCMNALAIRWCDTQLKKYIYLQHAQVHLSTWQWIGSKRFAFFFILSLPLSAGSTSLCVWYLKMSERIFCTIQTIQKVRTKWNEKSGAQINKYPNSNHFIIKHTAVAA